MRTCAAALLALSLAGCPEQLSPAQRGVPPERFPPAEPVPTPTPRRLAPAAPQPPNAPPAPADPDAGRR